MHDLDAIGRYECRAIVVPISRYHSPSLCPLAEIGLHRAVIIDFNAAHDHAIIVLLDMGAWIPLSSRPCVGLPSIGNEAIVEKELDQPVAAIRPYARKS